MNKYPKYSLNGSAFQRVAPLVAVTIMGLIVLFMMMSSVGNNDPSTAGTSVKFRGHLSQQELVANSQSSAKVTVANQSRSGLRIPSSISIAVVADLDRKSKFTDDRGKTKFYSLFRRGEILQRDHQFSVTWSKPEKFDTVLNEAGRGFELSALKWFQGRLFTVDDRTGIVFELHDFRGSGMGKMIATAKYILMEGNGESSAKGQKSEWITVKDGKMYVGSIGKEYTDNDGNLISENNFWVSVIDQHGKVEHENWKEYYSRLREALGCAYPAYVIHEAIEWSAVHRKWFILPRRVSKEPYHDMEDEKKGSNVFLIANEDFTDIDVRVVGTITPERGFSAFKFIPYSQDTIIVALKSMENEELQKQASYIMVFDIDGKVLMDETEIPGDRNKYEGLAMLNDWSPRQPHFDR